MGRCIVLFLMVLIVGAGTGLGVVGAWVSVRTYLIR